MRRSYLVGPFICCLAVWTFGNGTLPLLPLYAMELGASQQVSGLFLSFAFLCLALGNGIPAVLPKTFRKQRVLILAAALPPVVLLWLAGRVTTVLELALVTGATWFFAGVIFSQTATLVGLAATKQDRGTAFGILGMTNGLGGLLGGLSVGYIADHLGYSGAFGILAAFFLLIVVGGLLSLRSPSVLISEATGTSTGDEGRAGVGLALLFVAMLLTALSNATGNLGRSFLMAEDRFSKSAITLTGAVTGLAALGLPFLMGRLADRIGRRWVLIASIAITALSLVLLSFSRQLWHFCAFEVLFAFLPVANAIAPAYVVDVEPTGNVGRNVSLVQSFIWVGSIIGMAATGLVAARVGTSEAVLLSCAFPAAGAFLLLLRRKVAGQGEGEVAPGSVQD